MKAILLVFILPGLVNAGIFKALMKQGCDFDRESSSYICANIVNQFPEMFYGDYNLRCVYCDIEVFTKDTFPYKNKLLVFNVSESKIKTIGPRAFETLKYLEYIHLENNDIVSITEDAFYGLRRVFEIHLQNNKITSLTPGFVNGFEANALFLHHNYLTQIPNNAFRGLHSMMMLDLSFNSISSLEHDALKYINGLEILNMQHNELCTLPIGVFKHVRNIRTLNLASNKFTAFPLGLFSPLQDLVNLNISDNHLKEFHPMILLPLGRIDLLDISANFLRHLDPVTFKESMPTLRLVVFNDNFWTCSHLSYVIQYLRNRNIQPSSVDGVQRYDMMNINGIACLDSRLAEEVTFTRFIDLVHSATLAKASSGNC